MPSPSLGWIRVMYGRWMSETGNENENENEK